MKKRFTMFLVFAMILSLAACGGQQKTNPPPADTPSDEPSVSDAPQQADWPKRDISFICPAGAGGDTDYNTRLMARALEKSLGVSVVTTNVTGSNGAVCLTQYKDEPADNYTFIMTSTAVLSGNYATGLMDFGYEAYDPVCMYGISSGEVILVSADSPYETLEDLVKASQEKPGEIIYGGPTGGATYLAGFLNLQENYHAGFSFIEAGDGADRITALLGGHVNVTNTALINCKEYIEAGQVRPLATMLSKAPSAMSDIPVASEAYPNTLLDTMYVCLALKGTDPAVIERMNEAMLEVISSDEEFRADYENMNMQAAFGMDIQDTTAELERQKQQFVDLASLIQ